MFVSKLDFDGIVQCNFVFVFCLMMVTLREAL